MKTADERAPAASVKVALGADDPKPRAIVELVKQRKQELEAYKREHDLLGSEELADLVGCNRGLPTRSRYVAQLEERGSALRYPGPWTNGQPPWLYQRAAECALRELLAETARAHSESKSAWMKQRHEQGLVKYKTRTGIVRACDCGDPACSEVYRTAATVRGENVYASKQCANRTSARTRMKARTTHRRKNGLCTVEEARAEILKVSHGVAYRYIERGLIPIAEVFSAPGAGPPVIHLRKADVKRFARDRVRSSDNRVRRRFTPLIVFKEAIAADLPAARAEELANMATERERLYKSFRPDSGKPSTPPLAHYFDWLREWEALAPEARTHQCEHGDCRRHAESRLYVDGALLGYFCGAHAPLFQADVERLGLSERQAALTIARGHRDRFSYDPDEAEEAATKLVLYGIASARKALQNGGSLTRSL
jgi:hypothetical protein